MALRITEDCTNCDACPPVCPNEAITMGETVFKIDPLRCTECVGAEEDPQCVAVCPADCIDPDPDWQESKEDLQQKYDDIHG